MKEICGYEDSKGNFHKTKEEAEEAESYYRVQQIQSTLDNFQTEVTRYLWKEQRVNNVFNVGQVSDYIMQNIAEKILLRSDTFIEIINKKKELKKDLDLAYERYEKEKKKNRYSYKPWWLKLKWWK